jgi:UDP-N-acetylglucosamine 2-epimerase
MLKRIKILIIVGARPNFIKVAPLFEEFKKHKKIEPILVHTGQHYDYEMSKVFFQELEIPKPNYNLNIGSGMHGEQTGRIMMAIEKVYIKENPDLVVAVGDVNSALAGALVATKLHIPVAHIEAGNRMFNMKMPEEINRVLVDRISNLNFCVTKSSVGNLAKEGIKRGVYFTGDTMLDAFLHLSASVKKNEKIIT